MNNSKTEITDTSLVDCLVVAKGLPADERGQIQAFSGQEFSVEGIAMSLMNANGPKWTLRESATGEPLVVGGLLQTGPTRWQTFFLATQRAWDEYGYEVTKNTIKMLEKVLESQENVRVETYCLAARRKARAWYTRVGLIHEATLKGYGVNGESAVLYTYVKGAKD